MSLLSTYGLGFKLVFSAGGTIDGLDKVAKKTISVAQGFRNIGIGINTIRGAVTGLGQIALAGTYAAQRATKGLLNDYLAWDDRIQQMGGTFGDRFTAPMRRELRLLSQDFAMTFGLLPSQAAAGMDAMAKAGLDTVEKMRAIGPAAFAISKHEGSMAPEEASRAMIEIASQFSIPMQDEGAMRLLADKIQTASDISLASVKDLMTALSATGVKLSESGTSVDEALSLLSTMAQKGLKGAPAGHGLGRILTQMGISRARNLAEALKWSALGPGGSMKDIIDIVSEVSELAAKSGVDALDEIQIKTILMQTRGERAANAIIGGGGRAAYDNAMEAMANASGKLERTMAIRGHSVKMMFDKIKAAAMTAAAEIVDSYGPQIEDAMGSAIHWVGQLVVGLRRVSDGESLAGLDQSVQDFIKGMQRGIQNAKDVWSELVVMFEKAENALGPVAEKLGISVTTMVILGPILGPVILIVMMLVGAIASVVAIAIGLIQVLVGVGQVGVGAFLGLKMAAAWLMVNPFSAALIGLLAIGLAFGDWDDWVDVVDSLKKSFTMLSESMAAAFGILWAVLGPVLEKIGKLVSWSIKEIALLIENLLALGGAPVLAALAALGLAFVLAMGPLAPFVLGMTAVLGVLGLVAAAINGLIGLLKDLADELGNAVSAAVEATLTPAQKAAIQKHISVEAAGAQKLLQNYFGMGVDSSLPGAGPGATGVAPSAIPTPVPKPPIGAPKPPAGPSGRDVGDAKQPWSPTFDMQLDVASNINVQGKKIGGAVARHAMEVSERSGSKLTPWQRVQIVEKGVTPAGMGA